MAPRILITAVIYNRDPQETPVWNSLLKNHRDVFIYDNSPNPVVPENLPEGWVYVSDPTNPGLSTAYNEAAKEARRRGCDWLLISDQDTEYPPSAINIYLTAAGAGRFPVYFPAVRIGDGKYISPVAMRNYRCRPASSRPGGAYRLASTAVINSGMMVNVDLFFKAGGYNPDVTLDFSDFQFIERISQIESQGFCLPLTLRQDFSNETQTPEEKLSRFTLFCRSLSGYQPLAPHKVSQIRNLVIRRALSLCAQTRSIRPLSIMRREYKPREPK